MTVGVRQAKARFSHYIDVARTEGDVVITDRGRPVARLTAITSARGRTVEGVVAQLAEAGLIDPAEKPGAGPRGRQAAVVQTRGNASVSAAVRAMRR